METSTQNKFLSFRILTSTSLYLFLVFFLIYGWSFSDHHDLVEMAVNPFRAQADSTRQFLYSSPLPIFICSSLTKLMSPDSAYYATVSLGLVALLLMLTLWLRSLPHDNRFIAVSILQITPLTLILLTWLGKGDCYLLAGYVGLQLGRLRPSIAFISSFIMILAHREQGVVVLVIDAILRQQISSPVILGVLSGVFGVALYQSHVEGLTLTRVGLGLRLLSNAAEGWIENPMSHLIFGIGWTWVIVCKRLRTVRSGRMIAALVIAYGVGGATQDFTRVVTILAFPVIILLAEEEGHFRDSPTNSSLSKFYPIMALIQVQIQSFSVVTDSVWGVHVRNFIRQLALW